MLCNLTNANSSVITPLQQPSQSAPHTKRGSALFFHLFLSPLARDMQAEARDNMGKINFGAEAVYQGSKGICGKIYK